MSYESSIESAGGRSFSVNCALIENRYEDAFDNVPYYGLRLEMRDSNGFYESSQINDISVVKDDIACLLDLLEKNSVTPVCFYDVVEDWINQRYAL